MSTTSNLAAAERGFLALMVGLLEHLGPESSLIGKVAAMAVKVRTGPFGHRSGNPPAARAIGGQNKNCSKSYAKAERMMNVMRRGAFSWSSEAA
jgi:hypothetical protein